MDLTEKMAGRKRVVGIGSALMDILIQAEEPFLEKVGAVKGGMRLVEENEIHRALSMAADEPVMVPGGSACNTVVGIGKMGGQSRFLGKCGADETGRLFENDLKAQCVEPDLLRSRLPTGKVLSIITPDKQRSMLTFLGASARMRPEEIRMRRFEDAAVVHIEGYLLFNQALMFAALSAAKNAGALISLDLASFTVVETHKDVLAAIVHDYVDILMANEDEARVFTGRDNEADALRQLSKYATVAILKVGKRGSYIAVGEDVVKIKPVVGGRAVDTTGAGDLWASGFLHAFIKGHSPLKCGQLGSLCGHAVCQVVGTHISEAHWVQIRQKMEA